MGLFEMVILKEVEVEVMEKEGSAKESA